MEFMNDQREDQIAGLKAVAEMVTHNAHPVDGARKRDLLVDILSQRWQEQILVFGKTKHGCNRLAEQLEKAGISAVAIHGNKSQAQRLKALSEFKSGKARILVATDVAARGLDIPQLPLVINFDLPMVAEDYVHRIGRTGRAGAAGLSVTLVTRDDTRMVGDIERLIKKKIEIEPFEFDDERPRRPPRRRDDDEERREPAYERPVERRAQAAPSDPLFDRPYEPSGSGTPQWEEKAQPQPVRRTVSPNIKPKRKVASLLGGGG
jgi:ATP-dependent RNA helicase RhlE